MRKASPQETLGYLSRNQRRRKWKKAVSVLACLVVFCTTYALILPALTMEETTRCGKTEHTHTEACYTQITTEPKVVPLCTLEGILLHEHTEECLDENGEYSCGYSDFVIHEHDASCYDENGELWCPLPEVKAHTHEESCYAQKESAPVHTHTDACYTLERGELLCAIPEGEGAHTHSVEAGCYDENGQLICQTEESEGHLHTDDCYAQNRVLTCQLSTEPAEDAAEKTLICGKEEIIPHEHDADCFDENGNLICGKQQVLEHVHREACVQTIEEPVDTETLTCTIPEGEGAHTHSVEAGCYDENGTLICQEEETEGHQHGPLCYGTWVLTCDKEEHTHSQDCFIDTPTDPDADLETAEDWEATLPEELPARWDQAVLAVAESQLGYEESTKNFLEDENGSKKGYTRYGQWYGDPYGDWCAMFVSFCLHYGEIPAEEFPLEANCPRWIEQLKDEKFGRYAEAAEYIPEPGDVVFFDWEEDGTSDHVGLVAELLTDEEGTLTELKTIEGNSGDRVQYVTYPIADQRIMGYGILPEEPRAEYSWSQDGMEVLASVPQDETLPENAELVVERLTPEEDEAGYGQKYAASQEEFAAEEAAEISHFDLFQVSLMADGEEVLPQKEATVEIRLQEEEYPVTPRMEFYHYGEDGTAAPAAELREEDGSLTGSFETELSGAYAIVGAEALADDISVPSAQADQEEVSLTPHKTIDAFRDGADNPDTELDNTAADKTDLYRLYLDAELSAVNNPIDLLIIVDQSGSMHNDYQGNAETNKDMTKENGESAYRDEALRLVLNGTSNNTDMSVYEANKQNGLIYQFLAANDENQVAVVGFQGHGYPGSGMEYYYGSDYWYQETAAGELADVTSGKIQTASGDVTLNVSSGIADDDGYLEAETLLPWTSEAGFVNVQGMRYNATNYTAGFTQAQRELDRPAVNNGHQKVILFLSDGAPTCHIVKGEEHYYRDGDGNSENGGTGTTTGAATTTAFENFMKDNQGVILHTVSICGGTSTATRLQNMATGYGDCYTVTQTSDMENKLKKLMVGATYTRLTIQDTLSSYVDLHEQPDFKVTRKETDGTLTTLYENGAVTDAGTGVIQSVTYEKATKTVTALFDQTYTAEPGTTVTLSFNVQTTETAYQEYVETGYSHKGDPNTDYNGTSPANETSSEKSGFRSNDVATVSYEKQVVGQESPTTESKEYPHPVVQVTDRELVVKKQWLAYNGTDETNIMTSGNVQFTLYREANYIGNYPPTATVTVYTKRDGGNEQEKQHLEAIVGSNVSLTFEQTYNRYIGSSSISGIQINGVDHKIVPSSKPGSWGSVTDTYNHSFQVAGDTDIIISYTGNEPSITGLASDNAPPSTDWPKKEKVGTYTLSSENNWEETIKNLPKSGTITETDASGNPIRTIDVSYTYYVEENVNVEDYKTSYSYVNKNGNKVEGGLPAEGTATISNRSTKPYTHELPATGGAGTTSYTLGGLLLIAAAGVLLLYYKKKRRKEDFGSS